MEPPAPVEWHLQPVLVSARLKCVDEYSSPVNRFADELQYPRGGFILPETLVLADLGLCVLRFPPSVSFCTRVSDRVEPPGRMFVWQPRGFACNTNVPVGHRTLTAARYHANNTVVGRIIPFLVLGFVSGIKIL